MKVNTNTVLIVGAVAVGVYFLWKRSQATSPAQPTGSQSPTGDTGGDSGGAGWKDIITAGIPVIGEIVKGFS